MGRRRNNNNGGVGKLQKYYNISSIACPQGSSVFVGAGNRLVAVRGANSGAPTYSFAVNVAVYSTSAGAAAQSITYTNVPNGRKVSLMKDFPFMSNRSSAVTAVGELAVSVTAGADSPLEVYISTGATPIDLLSPVLSGGSSMPPAVRDWLSNNPPFATSSGK